MTDHDTFAAIVGVEPERGWPPGLGATLGAAGCRIERWTEAEALARAPTWSAGGEAPVVVLLAESVRHPWPLARTLHLAAPWAHLVFLTPSTFVEAQREAAARLPLIGSRWTVADPAADGFAAELGEALRSARLRLEYQAALTRMNAQLRDVAGGSVGRDTVVTNHYLASILEHAEDAILAVDDDGTISSWNRSADRLFGLEQAAALGREVGFLVDAHEETLAELVAAARAGSPVRNRALIGRRGDGSTFHAEMTLAPVFDEEGRIVSVSVIARDVTERRRQEAEIAALNEALAGRVRDLGRANAELEAALEQLEVTQRELLRLNATLERQATTDALTGLKNRIVFQNSIEEMIAVADRQGSPLSLLLVDIDHFKRINDTRGHQEGDRVLQAVARALGAQVRDQDIVARFGGEEFAVLLPNTGLGAALTVAEHLRFACGRAARLEPRLTVSIGAAGYVRGETEATLIGRADAALYAAKAQGRDRVVAAAEVERPEPA
jgi:diguanylate cyclase (GGDEF)-like protein/PAS domain S-box-containing protein